MIQPKKASCNSLSPYALLATVTPLLSLWRVMIFSSSPPSPKTPSFLWIIITHPPTLNLGCRMNKWINAPIQKENLDMLQDPSVL